MNNIKFIKTILLMVPLLGLSSFGQTKEVQVTRTHIWLRGQVKVKINKHWGAVAMAGSRYNLSYSKEVNGKEMDNQTQNAWLQELWLGPFYATKLTPTLSFSINALYRPQFWYIDEAKEPRFTRHTIHNAYNLKWTPGKISPHFRLIAWHQFGANQTDDIHYDYEFLLRNLIGLTYKLNTAFKLVLEDEVFLKTTADESDVDGSEFFQKNVIWTGLDYMPSKSLALSLRYVPFFTNKTDNAAIKVDASDHHFLLEFRKTLKL